MTDPIISPRALAEAMTGPGCVVVDTRFRLTEPEAGREAWRAGHLPGARYLHLDEDLAAPPRPGTGRHPLPDPGALAGILGRAGIGPASLVVAYDDAGGAIAARLWWLLRWLGHDHAAVLDGGFQAWVGAGLPVERAAHAPVPATFVGTPGPERVVGTAELAAPGPGAPRLLVDAREPERFLGRSEPIDAVAGHVPGAVNHPFRENLGPDGRFLPPVELRRRWRALLGDTRPVDAAVMCGSGVTACHHLLAMERAGLPGARLYAGSWSEWIADPRRPVAREA